MRESKLRVKSESQNHLQRGSEKWKWNTSVKSGSDKWEWNWNWKCRLKMKWKVSAKNEIIKSDHVDFQSHDTMINVYIAFLSGFSVRVNDLTFHTYLSSHFQSHSVLSGSLSPFAPAFPARVFFTFFTSTLHAIWTLAFHSHFWLTLSSHILLSIFSLTFHSVFSN